MTMRPPARMGIAAVLLMLSAASFADVLVSASGDRLNGKLVAQRDGLLVFDSDLLGRLEVSAELARVEGGPVAAWPAAVSSPPAKEARPDAPASGWSSDVGVRLSVDRGSLETPEEDLRISVKANRRTRHGAATTGIDFRHRQTDDVLKDDDWDIEIGYERFLGDSIFVAGRALATRELASGSYDETQVALVATGWRLWEAQNQHLRVGPALGYLNAIRSQEQVDAPALGLYATTEGQAWAKVRFSGELVVLDTLGDGRYANLELRLRQPLGERLYLALVWEYAWSSFDIESGVRSEWRWDLGWRFGQGAGR